MQKTYVEIYATQIISDDIFLFIVIHVLLLAAFNFLNIAF